MLAEANSLPRELLLEIFSWLPLKSIIATRGVSRLWRELVPLANILPDRRDLYDLFMAMIHSDELDAHKFPIPVPFDRERYLSDLLKAVPGATSLPREFDLWIREWPSRLVMDWIWPSLPAKSMIRPMIRPGCPPVCEIIDWSEPQILDGKPTGKDVRLEVYGLGVAEHGCGWTTWLVLGGPREDLIGTVHLCEGDRYYEGEEDDGWLIAKTWTQWLKDRHRRSENDTHESSPKLGSYSHDK